jgi:hypothetical protein
MSSARIQVIMQNIGFLELFSWYLELMPSKRFGILQNYAKGHFWRGTFI